MISSAERDWRIQAYGIRRGHLAEAGPQAADAGRMLGEAPPVRRPQRVLHRVGRRGSGAARPGSSRGPWRPACPRRTWSGAGVSAGCSAQSSRLRVSPRRDRARVYMASAPVTSTTSSVPLLMARQASCMRACGVLPPTAESMSSAGSSPSAKPRRAATWRAGLTACHPRGTTTRMLSARASRAVSGRSRPAGRDPVAILRGRPQGPGHELDRFGSLTPGSSGASGGVTTWPTPTTTGVRGSRAMARGAYRVTPRGLPGRSVDSTTMPRRRRLGSRRVRPEGDPAGRTRSSGP